ncbi:MAG: RNA ligase [Candidatus Bilamarchaeaceae archaeon]
MFRGEIKKEEVEKAIARGRAEKCNEEIEYIRFAKPHKGIERGTVITRGAIIWGYPHIKRVFRLETGITRNIRSNIFYVEEKIDGYNLRIASISGKPFAFTRGGYLDPFATEKVREMPTICAFFETYPDYVLCAEMIGNTPYTPPTEKFDIALFVFDVDNGNGYLPPLQKYSILKKFGLKPASLLGRFDKSQIAIVKKIAENLNKGKREGIVIKSADRTDVVKFVTPFADVEDIEKCAYTFFDMPGGFFYQRILRSAYFINEFKLEQRKHAELLGNAFYSGLSRAIKDVSEGRDVEEEFEIVVSDESIFDRIRAHIGKEVEVKVIFKRKERNRVRIRFSKVYKKTTKMLRMLYEGKGVID